MSEARNLRNMTIAQTPLLGDENTPMHADPTGGTGFEGATPRHQVAFTPNPLATPLRPGAPGDVAATPRDLQTGATPLRTPIRDGLRINPDGDGFAIPPTPREVRRRETPTARSLKAGFMSLPKPENNFELLVPEDEDEEGGEAKLSVEDAAERDAKIRRFQEEEQQKALARRSVAVQKGLPRPVNVDVSNMLERLNIADDGLDAAAKLVHEELVQILQHDAISYPLPGTALPGGTKSAYLIPDDEVVASAKSAIQSELASALGYPDANEGQLKEGIAALSQSEEVDETLSWSHIQQQVAWDPATNSWVDPDTLSPEDRIAGFAALLDRSRDTMASEAQKAGKSEKKLNVTLGGYQVRYKALTKRIIDAFEELSRTKLEYESFIHLRANENATGPLRVSSLKEEVEKLESRERNLQGRYAELDGERRDLESRVGVLEDKLMAEAEALNEAALAEMEDVEAEAS